VKRFLIAFFYLVVFPVLLFAQRDVDLISLKLFESGYNPPPRDERYYTTSFDRDDTRYIFYEVHLDNNLYNIRDNSLKIQAKYYYPNGSLMSDPILRKTMYSDWETGYFWHGWGWDDSGNWEEGRYTIEIYIDGRYVTEKKFTVYDSYNSRDYSRSREFELEELNFFEAGYNLPDREDYRYKTYFDKYDSRYIYTEIVVRNNLYEIRTQTHELEFEYYNPDGSLRGRIKADYTIDKDWKTSWISRGWGWDERGNWPVGTYTVEVYSDDKFIGDGQFTIYD
jgi:hypothetical protein